MLRSENGTKCKDCDIECSPCVARALDDNMIVKDVALCKLANK